MSDDETVRGALDMLENIGLPANFAPHHGRRIFLFSIFGGRARLGVGDRIGFDAIW